MAKGDDAVRRKKNKANRKKFHREQGNSSSAVSARVAAIIASKKRRLSGKRKQCMGMCFSLPTPDDPFNDRHDGKDLKAKENKKVMNSRAADKEILKQKGIPSQNGTLGNNDLRNGYAKIQVNVKDGVHDHHGEFCEKSEPPSKFLILCLHAIENALRSDCSNEDNPLFVNPWGVEFWKCYSAGKDVLETSGSSSTVEQIAWMISAAADTITRKEKEGVSFSSPFLLFLVPTQEKAVQIRSVCKPLKALGIHTVSIHPGASIDHQIQGLRSCEPEFLVSTPERLLELVSMNAVNISGVSMLVVDGLESLSSNGYIDVTKSIRQSISGNPHTVVFSDCFNSAYVPLVQNILRGSVCRLSLNDSVTSRSACIIQSINLCTSEGNKLSKVVKALDCVCGNQLTGEQSKMLIIVGNNSKIQKVVAALKSKGYSISVAAGSTGCIPESENSLESDVKMKPVISIVDVEHVSTTDLDQHEAVFLLKSPPTIEDYIQILTRMARHSVKGVLQSFITKEEATLVGPLIEILQQCGQTVTETIRNLCLTTGISG